MATAAKLHADPGVGLRLGRQGGERIARAIDRWIYVFTAASFIVVTLLGFIPDALHKMELVRTGQRPPFPLVLHFHALFMGSFLLLLLLQATLMATGRQDLHRRLGRVAMVLVPAMVVAGFLLVPAIYHQTWSAMQAATPQGSMCVSRWHEDERSGGDSSQRRCQGSAARPSAFARALDTENELLALEHRQSRPTPKL